MGQRVFLFSRRDSNGVTSAIDEWKRTTRKFESTSGFNTFMIKMHMIDHRVMLLVTVEGDIIYRNGSPES